MFFEAEFCAGCGQVGLRLRKVGSIYWTERPSAITRRTSRDPRPSGVDISGAELSRKEQYERHHCRRGSGPCQRR